MTGIYTPRTKIVCTLGPSTSTDDAVRGLIEAGMNVARVNFSHGTHDQHAATIAMWMGFRRTGRSIDDTARSLITGLVHEKRSSATGPGSGEPNEVACAGRTSLTHAPITIRVPWHDSGWAGSVCTRPLENTSCLILPRIGEGKRDQVEARCAGRRLDELECRRLAAAWASAFHSWRRSSSPERCGIPTPRAAPRRTGTSRRRARAVAVLGRLRALPLDAPPAGGRRSED